MASALSKYLYYRRHQKRLLNYYAYHHKMWKGMKRFARKTGMTLPQARNYIDRKLYGWYLCAGLVEELPKRPYSRRREIFHSSEPVVHQLHLPDKGGQSHD